MERSTAVSLGAVAAAAVAGIALANTARAAPPPPPPSGNPPPGGDPPPGGAEPDPAFLMSPGARLAAQGFVRRDPGAADRTASRPEAVDTDPAFAEWWGYSDGRPYGTLDTFPWVYLREYGAAGTLATNRLFGGAPIPGGDPIIVLHEEQASKGIGLEHPFRATRKVDTARAANGAILAWIPADRNKSDKQRRALVELEWAQWKATTVWGRRKDVYREGERTPQAVGGGRTKLIRRRWEMLTSLDEAPVLGRRLATEAAASREWARFFTSGGTSVLGLGG